MTPQNNNSLPMEAVQRHIKAVQSDLVRRAKLLKTCDGFTQGLDCSAEDLLQEACLKVLSGDRHWPAEVLPEAFLTEVIRSLADAHRKALRTGRVDYGMSDELYAQVRDSAPSADRDNPDVSVTEADAAQQHLKDLLHHFKGKPEVQLLILLRGAGYKGEELMTITGLNREQYRAVYKRLERGLNDFKQRQALSQ